MGLDQRIWAEINVNTDEVRQVAIHYWRKDYEIDRWFFSRLTRADAEGIEARKITAWTCKLTSVDLDELEANQCALALQIEVDLELIWRCRCALGEGFRLSYSRSS